MVIVKGLIVRDEKYLLCQVKTTARYEEVRGKWELPGGHLEGDESPEETLIRELKEELDVDCRLGPLCYTGLIEVPGEKIKLFVYHVNEILGSINLSEHNRVDWVHPFSFDMYDILPYYRKCLKVVTGF